MIDAGIEVIVTDHHELHKETPPNKYTAFVNPQRPDCEYDKAISGCTVAYLLCLSVAKEFNIDALNNLDMQNLLAITSVTTISDSMRLNSITNRAIVKTGLKIVNSLKIRNWCRLIYTNGSLVNYKTYGWSIAPVMNSASRMGNPNVAYKIFMEQEDKDIREAVVNAIELNKSRKNKQKTIEKEARDEYLIDFNNKYAITSKVTDGFGIQGIVSSKLVGEFQLPCVVFYDSDKSEFLQGSGRSIKGVNLLKALRIMEKLYPNDIVKCGGHEEAAGITIKKSFYQDFKKLFNIVISQLSKEKIDDGKMIYVDAELKEIDYSILDSLNLLSPYGTYWEEPVFICPLQIDRLRVNRYSGSALEFFSLNLHNIYNKISLEALYFPRLDDTFELKEKGVYNFVFTLEVNEYKGGGIKLNIKHILKY